MNSFAKKVFNISSDIIGSFLIFSLLFLGGLTVNTLSPKAFEDTTVRTSSSLYQKSVLGEFTDNSGVKIPAERIVQINLNDKFANYVSKYDTQDSVLFKVSQEIITSETKTFGYLVNDTANVQNYLHLEKVLQDYKIPAYVLYYKEQDSWKKVFEDTELILNSGDFIELGIKRNSGILETKIPEQLTVEFEKL